MKMREIKKLLSKRIADLYGESACKEFLKHPPVVADALLAVYQEFDDVDVEHLYRCGIEKVAHEFGELYKED